MSVNNNLMHRVSGFFPRFLSQNEAEPIAQLSKLFAETMQLRDQIMKMLGPEQAALEQIISLDLNKNDLPQILALLKLMPNQERTLFISQIHALQLPTKRVRLSLISFFAKLPPDERSHFLNHLAALKLVRANDAKSAQTIKKAVHDLAPLYQIHNQDLVKPIRQLNLSVADTQKLVGSLQSLSVPERGRFLEDILSLNLPKEQRTAEILQELMWVPREERPVFVQQLRQFKFTTRRTIQKFSALSLKRRRRVVAPSDYANFSEKEKERDLSDLLNRVVEEGAQSVNQGFSPLSLYPSLLSLDPIQVLIRYANKCLNQNTAVTFIRYQDVPAQDAGGVTRDFVTKLFDGFCSFNLTLQTSPVGGKPLPKIKIGNEREFEQRFCFQALGFLFALALLNYKNIKIGNRFNLGLYAMLHTLSQEEMRQLNRLQEFEAIPKPIYEKLLRLYLKTNCASYFGVKLQEQELTEAIHQLVEGNAPNDFLRNAFEIENLDQLLEMEQIPSIIYATCHIAKGIHYFVADWDNRKGVRAENLLRMIEGDLLKSQCIQVLRMSEDCRGEENPAAQVFLRRWIQEANNKQLETLVYAMTGSRTLSDEGLVIDLMPLPPKDVPLPKYHTCTNTIDLYNYPSFEIFKEKLELSLAHIQTDGFTNV